MSLDDRKKHILESIVKDYVETAEPVGSRAMVKKHNLRVSAATVRNEMADLEDLGYLEQPHTSAGRIPSENGFRYYVDCMMEKERLGEEEIDVLEKILKANLRDWDSVIQSIGSFLSQVTRYTSFIIVPTIRFNEFRYIQLIPVEPGTAMVILVTDTGILMHRKIDVPSSVEPKDLNVINEVFNRIFTGKRLEDLRKTDLKSLRDELKQRRKVIDQTLEAINSLMENTGDEKVVISGILNMLNEPEFKDLDKLKKILAILEADESLKSILPETTGDEVDITIGRENQREDVREMSIVLARYTMFGESGKIGVIGPVRMEYWKAAGSVDSIRKIIDDTLKKHY